MHPKDLFQQFYQRFYLKRDFLFRLILINILVFLIFAIWEVIIQLFNTHDHIYRTVLDYLYLPSVPAEFFTKPWTIVTYMFMHDTKSFGHILFNMLLLYWFGKLFLEFQKEKKLFWLYIFGGISGGALFIIAYQLIPALIKQQPAALLGASASVTAILIAIAALVPNYGINLLFIGQIRLKYIALFLIIVDILSLNGTNAGGHVSHLGGAVYGLLFTLNLRGKIPLIPSIRDFFKNLGRSFSKDRIKTIRYKESKKTDKSEKNSNMANKDQEIIDHILDKISHSGYESLTEDEKDRLFRASKK